MDDVEGYGKFRFKWGANNIIIQIVAENCDSVGRLVRYHLIFRTKLCSLALAHLGANIAQKRINFILKLLVLY